MTRILVAGSSYVHSQPLQELCKLWSRVVQHLDPDVDIVLIDSISPFKPEVFLGWPLQEEAGGTSGDFLKEGPRRWVWRFSENIGHLSRGGEDGAGRTFCKSIEIGIANNYDYVVVIESDLIFLRSVTEIVARLKRTGTPVAALPNLQYQFPELGVCFIDCKWAKEFDYIGKYDWKKSQPWPIPEIRTMNILQDHLVLLPIYGMRIDQMQVNASNLQNYFPYYPPAWLTHAHDMDTYLKAIMLNNIQLK